MSKKAQHRITTEQLMDAKKLDASIKKLARQIYKDFHSGENLTILGIRTRGVTIADRIREILNKKYQTALGSGMLDITFYRDDLSKLGPNPTVRDSELPLSITGSTIILVDDVVYTGRTVRAALDEISDFGRPAQVKLAALVDRGLRELPIQPDYRAMKISSTPNQRIHVMLDEDDSEEQVVMETVSDESNSS